MKKILIVNDEMVVGGVARVLNNMLNHLTLDDYQIDLLILHKHGDMLKDIDPKYKIIEGTDFFKLCDISLGNAIKSKNISLIIKKIYFYLLMKSGLITKKIKKERKKILKDNYDVEIAYKEGFCTIFVASGDSVKKVNWVHVDYGVHNYSANHMKLMKNILKNIDEHVSQSNDAAKSYKKVFEINDEFKIVNNFIDTKLIKKMALEPFEYQTPDFNIVAVGRLHFQKAVLRLCDVVKKLKDDNYKFHIYIIGDGEQRIEVEEKIKLLKIENELILVGYDKNPFKYIKNADLFLLPSLYESAPTVVYEALTINTTPILSTEVAGVNGQLNCGELGMICDNSETGLYTSLKLVLNDTSILERYRENMKKFKNTNDISENKFREIIGV